MQAVAVLCFKRTMIEPFWDVLRRLSNDETDAPDSVEQPSHHKNSENAFLAVLPIVRKIVRRRLIASEQADAAADLEQGIILRLLNWREKNQETSEKMSEGDWKSFAAKTAYNETNRHYSKSAGDAALDAASALESPERLAGDSKIEFQSLARFVWQGTCQMTLRQRRALLLHSRKLIVYFLQGGVKDEELAQSLELEIEEWLEVKIKLPLSNARIARFVGVSGGESRNLESAIRSIKKARHEARRKLRLLTNK